MPKLYSVANEVTNHLYVGSILWINSLWWVRCYDPCTSFSKSVGTSMTGMPTVYPMYRGKYHGTDTGGPGLVETHEPRGIRIDMVWVKEEGLLELNVDVRFVPFWTSNLSIFAINNSCGRCVASWASQHTVSRTPICGTAISNGMSGA